VPGRELSRRGFLSVLGASAVGASITGLVASCGSDGAVSPPETGRVRGTVTDLQGVPQAIGRIYLLRESGLNTGRYVDVDASGQFAIGAITPGAYQIRYWAGSEAYVPEPAPNPVRVTVESDVDVAVEFEIALGSPDENQIEIYVGDDFYQPQPFGEINAPVTVKLGTMVCWYNVGQHQHTVTGGPWGDSGVIGGTGEFEWVADQVGTFGYRCVFHDPQMRATLEVVA
jgi:plastocyanin